MPPLLRADESTEVVWSMRDLRLSSTRTRESRCLPESCANSRPSTFQCWTQLSRSFSMSNRLDRSFNSLSRSPMRSTWSLGVPSRSSSVRARSTAPWMASAASCQYRSWADRPSLFCASNSRWSCCEASADACIMRRWRCSTSFRLGALAKMPLPELRPWAGIVYPKSGQAFKGSIAHNTTATLFSVRSGVQRKGAAAPASASPDKYWRICARSSGVSVTFLSASILSRVFAHCAGVSSAGW